MQKELLQRLETITEEEKKLLEGADHIARELYAAGEASPSEFTIDSRRLLEKGQLIKVRPHTRFVYFPRHKHNYVELVYMCKGTTTHLLNDGKELVLQEGDLLFLNQNASHEIAPAGKDDIAVNFIILPEFFDRSISMIEEENVLRDFLLESLSGKNAHFSYLHFPAKEILPVQNLLENMIWTIFSDRENTNTINQTTMGLMLMNLSLYANEFLCSTPEQMEQALIFDILSYVDTHYKSGSLAEISAKIKRPTYYVSRLLTKHLNKNFKELLQERKLQQAAYLLTQSSLSIEQIMDAIGYNNSSYFYRAFRDKYHCSPKEYRSLRL